MAVKDIKTVCVIGAGIMGRQIALNAAVHNYSSVLCDVSEEALVAAKAWCTDYLNKSVEKQKMTKENAEGALARLAFEPSIEKASKQADLVIEAIVEKLDIKRELFANLSKWAPEDALLTSNSSYIPSSSYADIVKNPSRVANLHYFNPAMRMELVEIVKGEHTADDTVQALEAFITGCEKIFIIVNKEVEGFIVNRLLRAMQDEAYRLLEDGVATFSDIDLGAEKGLNWPMGPFRLMDFTGLDINYYNRKKKFDETGLKEDEPPTELVKRFEQGEYGRKTGKGWYDYTK